MNDRIRFAIVGAGKRSDYLFGPLLTMLKDEVELVGVWGRSEAKVRAFGEKFRVPWFTNLERLRDESRPEAAVVSVSSEANGEIGSRVIELGFHALLETPIAQDLVEADAIVAGAAARNLKLEVAEQYFRRPIERLKRALIRAGIFGQVLTAYNDCMGHGYHGVSLIRSYIGFDARVRSVNGAIAKHMVAPYYSWIDQSYGSREEEWQHAILHFDDGRLGFFNWSDIAYDSSLRWLRSSKFFAEKGMAVGDRLTLLTPDGKDPQPIEIERRFHNVGGMETLVALIAHTTPEISWYNPFQGYTMDDEMIAVADCLMSLVRAIRENCPPEYGAEQARLDQEVTLALGMSAQYQGEPIKLPLPRL
jgi:predicted dehydrogenase